VEGLREHDEIEISAYRLPFLEGRPFDASALPGGDACHPLVRLNGEHVRAGFGELLCRNAGSGADVKHPHADRRHETSDEWLWVPRSVPVVLFGSSTE
jgi:hypothetical protein